ncbi:unnamed protein product [Heterobilharzia americana]|nr:unnamed protein product [Heterobilharzia americana]
MECLFDFDSLVCIRNCITELLFSYVAAPLNRVRARHRTSVTANDQLEEPNSLHLTTIPSTSAGVSNVVDRVRDQQQRWKGNVEAQRVRVRGSGLGLFTSMKNNNVW